MARNVNALYTFWSFALFIFMSGHSNILFQVMNVQKAPDEAKNKLQKENLLWLMKMALSIGFAL